MNFQRFIPIYIFQSLAQEHFIEQQHLLKDYLHPKSKFFPNWDPNPKNDVRDIPTDVETAIMAEHRRHLQNQLNLLKENIVSAVIFTGQQFR